MKTKLVVRKYTFKNWKDKKTRPPAYWWIEGLPYDECQRTRCGPYHEYQDALSDKEGMQRVFDNPNYK